MGCSSCGQRYRAAQPAAPSSARIAERQQRILQRRKLMANSDPDTSPASGIIQPQPLQGVLAPVYNPNLDPATGQEISVIKTGVSDSGTLGDTTLAPVAVCSKEANE